MNRLHAVYDFLECTVCHSKNTTPMLLQTNMRDTGAILTDIFLLCSMGVKT